MTINPFKPSPLKTPLNYSQNLFYYKYLHICSERLTGNKRFIIINVNDGSRIRNEHTLTLSKADQFEEKLIHLNPFEKPFI